MRNKYKYNREFKTIDTEEKAYILGYFYGDGCITQCKQKRRNKIYIKYLCSILSKDKEIVDKIKNIYKFFNVCISKGIYYTLYVSGKDIYDDLSNNGVYQRKSSMNKDLLKIPKIENHLIPHFIRGLYDSDGGFYLYDTLVETFFCSTSLPFISEIKEWLSTNNIETHLTMRNRKESQLFYYIRSKSNHAAKSFFDLIYKDANIFMQRKRQVFTQGIMIDPTLKKSKYYSAIPGNTNQLLRLQKDYKNVVEKYKQIEKVEFPSVCCNYHTIQSGKSYKKGIIRPLFLCLKCGKRSVLNRADLK